MYILLLFLAQKGLKYVNPDDSFDAVLDDDK